MAIDETTEQSANLHWESAARAIGGWTGAFEGIRKLSVLLIHFVAQVSNLLYRSASSLRSCRAGTRLGDLGRSADWKSAIQQVGNLRYPGVRGPNFPLSLLRRPCYKETIHE